MSFQFLFARDRSFDPRMTRFSKINYILPIPHFNPSPATLGYSLLPHLRPVGLNRYVSKIVSHFAFTFSGFSCTCQ